MNFNFEVTEHDGIVSCQGETDAGPADGPIAEPLRMAARSALLASLNHTCPCDSCRRAEQPVRAAIEILNGVLGKTLSAKPQAGHA
jgi:hypothetical protein